MYNIDPLARKPIYEQIIDQLELFVATGAFKPGDRIPSVRSVSTSSGVNPMTILKAYGELDSRGVICSVPGRGYFVSEGAKEKIAEAKMDGLGGLKGQIAALCRLGVPKDSVYALVDEAYGETTAGGDTL